MSKYLAVICITIGICLSTMASSKPAAAAVVVAPSNATTGDADPAASVADAIPLWERLVGIGMLTFALFASALRAGGIPFGNSSTP